MDLISWNVEMMMVLLFSYYSFCQSLPRSQPQRRQLQHTTIAETSLGHEIQILHITDAGEQNPSSLANDLKIVHLKSSEHEEQEISLTNNLVTNPSSNRPLDYYREENPFVMSRMSRSERRCCRRGTRAARKGMNCNLGYSVQAGLHIMQDFKRASTGFKLSAKMSSRDSSFMKKAKKCFVKRETSQYYTRCCKEFGVIRSKRNN